MASHPLLELSRWYSTHQIAWRIHRSDSVVSACDSFGHDLIETGYVTSFRARIGGNEERPGTDLVAIPSETDSTEEESDYPSLYEFPIRNGDTLRVELRFPAFSTDLEEAIVDVLSEHLRIACATLQLQAHDLEFPPKTLTQREEEVLPLVVAGKSNPEIATALGISSRTVEKHLTSLLEKCGCENRFALIARGTSQFG